MAFHLKNPTNVLYSCVFSLLFFAVFSSSTKFQQTNFSGIWKVDSLKSNFRGYVSAVALKILQTKDTISIERTMHTGWGDTRYVKDTLPLDGKAMMKTFGTANSSMSIEWSGQALIESARLHDNMNNATYQATETWTLSPDGKILTDDRVVENDGEGGRGTCIAVYRRE